MEHGIGGGPDVRGEDRDFEAMSQTKIEFNNLLREHGVLASLHLMGVYEGEDTNHSRSLLAANRDQIADILQRQMNGEFRDEYIRMWDHHIFLYEQYTLGLRGNDQNRQVQARAELDDLSRVMGNFFASTDPRFSSDQTEGLMREHIHLTLSIMDAYHENDFSRMVDQVKAAAD